MSGSTSESAQRLAEMREQFAAENFTSAPGEVEKADSAAVDEALANALDTEPAKVSESVIDLRDEPAASNEPKLKPRSSRQERATRKRPTKEITVPLDEELRTRLSEQSEKHDCWILDYVRGAIEQYSEAVPVLERTRRSRSRRSQNRVSRSYEIGVESKVLLEEAAARTGRSQSDTFRQILRLALESDYVPAAPSDY